MKPGMFKENLMFIGKVLYTTKTVQFFIEIKVFDYKLLRIKAIKTHSQSQCILGLPYTVVL